MDLWEHRDYGKWDCIVSAMYARGGGRRGKVSCMKRPGKREKRVGGITKKFSRHVFKGNLFLVWERDEC